MALGACALLWASSAPAQARWAKRRLNQVVGLGSKQPGKTRARVAHTGTGKAIGAVAIGAYQRRYLILAKKKEAAIRRMIALMQSNVQLSCPGSARCPGYLFRLAELSNAMRMNRWAAAMGLHERIYRARHKKGLAQRLRRRQKTLFAASRKWLERALKQYVRITNNRRFAGFSRMDEVIFSVGDIAKALAEQAGRRKDLTNQASYQKIMLTMFSRLVQQFPRSKFVPDALLAKGEYFFNSRRFIEAIRVYRTVARFKTKVGAYAAYKIGWCFLNLKRHRLALAQFVRVVKAGRGGKNLLGAAQNDVVRAYSHIGRPAKAYGFFHGVGGKRPQVTRRLYLRLGTLYYAQGKNPDCIKVFRDALQRWPKDKVRCQWVTTIVDATINGGDKDRQVAAVRELGRVTRQLTQQLGPRARPVRRCRSATENTIKMLATQWHKEGIVTGNLVTLHRTKRLYQEYLRTYPKSKLVYLMRYQYADLVWVLAGRQKTAQSDWVQLAGLYTRIVKMRRPRGMKRADYVARRNGAALASVRCWINATRLVPGAKPAKSQASATRKCARRRGRRCLRWSVTYPKLAIGAAQRAMLGAFATYTRYVPRSAHLPVILFNACHIYWKSNHFAKATPLCLKVARKHSKAVPDVARAAAYRVVGMLTVRGLHRRAERRIDGFLKDKALTADAVFVARMHEHKQKAMWSRAEKLRAQKRFSACGAAYEAMARRYPKAKKMDTFYWNAGHCYEAAGMLGPAVAMRRRIIKSFPRSTHAALATYYTAGNYHNLAFFRDAARWYERFAKKHGSHRQAADALMWAIVLRGGLGQQRAMMKNAASFIQRYRLQSRKLSAKAFWLVVKMHENLGNADRLLINLQRYAREYARLGDVDKAIETHGRLAAMFWRRSCKVTPLHGQCIRIRYYRRKGHRKKQKRIHFLARDRRMVKAARRHVNRAWKLWANGRAVKRIPRGAPNRAEMVRNARHWAAYARFMQAELRFEGYLKLRLPRRLSWDPRNARRFARTVKRFRAWIMKKLLTARALTLSYLATVTKVRITEQAKLRGDPHWSIAAVARTGMVYHNFAELLLSIQPPAYLRTARERDDFLTFIEKIAKRFQDRAQAGYRACLKVSGKLRWFNVWSRVCEREINRLEPDRYPLAGELRARPGYVAIRPGAMGFLLSKRGVK